MHHRHMGSATPTTYIIIITHIHEVYMCICRFGNCQHVVAKLRQSICHLHTTQAMCSYKKGHVLVELNPRSPSRSLQLAMRDSENIRYLQGDNMNIRVACGTRCLILFASHASTLGINQRSICMTQIL